MLKATDLNAYYGEAQVLKDVFISVGQGQVVVKLGAFSKNAPPHERDNLEKVFSLFPRLRDRQKQVASTMSGGEAKMLAVARGLMSNADFLCIEEPSLGLQPSLRFELFSTLKEINNQEHLSNKNCFLCGRFHEKRC